uniref:hypothetical protein n=1 Tax=Paenarthrobacter ureafaciens TaxID=37931 RepID=UPI003F4956FC
MDEDVWDEPPLQIDGQTSISDYLPATTAIMPVEVREPTDNELASFLATGTA